MAKIERVYNVPLRKEWLKVPKYKRAKKAVAALREFLQKHMKSENVKLGPELNKIVWVHGIKNPPHHVKVTVIKQDDGRVDAELFGYKAKITQAKTKKSAVTKTKISETVKKADDKVEAKIDKSEEKNDSTSEAGKTSGTNSETVKQERTEPKAKKASKK